MDIGALPASTTFVKRPHTLHASLYGGIVTRLVLCTRFMLAILAFIGP